MAARDPGYDAIVVGARCAGSPLAMLLARSGRRVLLVDRAHFPSDTMSTHFIQVSGVARLERWGLLDGLRATGCPPVRAGAIDFGGEPLEAETAVGELEGNFAPRRTVLDKLLVDAAVAAGAELREGVVVTGLLRDGERVTGIEGRDAAGRTFIERAGIVVGADGRHSTIASLVEAQPYLHVPTLGCGYYSYWSGVECDRAELFFRDTRFSVAFPTNDGLTTIAVGYPLDEWQDARRRPEEKLLETLDEMGTLGERVRAGRREAKLVGLRDAPNFLRTPYGPGWALAGDAGYHKDPIPAQGISDAFRDAELLARAIGDIHTERATEAGALAVYHEARDVFARPMFEATVKISSYTVAPVDRAQKFLELAMMQAEDMTGPAEVGTGAS
jgi:flavin-dependent dehydrogenase